MESQAKKPRKQGLSPIVAALMAFTLLGFGICGFGPVTEEFKTGKAYTLAVVFGQGTKVQRDVSPEAYWINLGWQILGFTIGIVLGLGLLFTIFANRKRMKSQK